MSDLRTRIITILATHPTAGLIDAIAAEIQQTTPLTNLVARQAAIAITTHVAHTLEDTP